MAATQLKLRQLQQDSASSDELIKWDGSVWAAGTASNSSLASGVGGIYKGSGTIPIGTIATIDAGAYFEMHYSGGTPFLAVDDSFGTLVLGNGTSVSIEFMSTNLINRAYANVIYYIDGNERLVLNDSSLTISSGTTASELRLEEPSGSGTNYTGFKAPILGSDIIYTLPATTSTGLLHNNGSNVWSWDLASNADLNTGVGGIYKGSGNIPAATTATLDGGFIISTASNVTRQIDLGDPLDAISGVVVSINHERAYMGNSDYNVIAWPDSTGVYINTPGSNAIFGTDITLNDSGGNLILGGGTSASELRFLEPSGSGSNYTAIKAGAQAGNITYVLPASVTDGYFLKYNSSGNQLEWATVTGGGIYGGSGSIATAAVATLADDSTFTIDYFDGSNALYLVDNGESFILSSGAGYGINANSSQVQVLGPNSDYLSVTSTGPVARGGLSITSGYLKLPSDITPSQITADQNDYSPTGLDDAAVVRLSSDASRTITGIDASTKGGDGDILTLINVGSFDIVLSDNDSASTATNRMALGGTDVTLGPGFSITLIYDDTSNIWRTFSFSGGGSADGNGIYSGSGTIPASTVATVTASDEFHINYSAGFNALRIDDGNRTYLYSPDNSSYIYVEDTNVTLISDGSLAFNVMGGSALSMASTINVAGRTNIYTGVLNSIDANAILELDGTDGGLLLNRLTTTQRDALSSVPDGLLLYNSTTDKLTIRANSAWVELGNGIYSGSGTIASGATATLPSSGTFTIAYNGGDPAIQINDTDQSVVIYDKTQTNYVYPNQYGVDIYHAKDIILNPAPSTDHTAFGLKIYLTANENQAFGDVVYINTDGEAQLADADAIATAKVIGMCTETVTANNVGTYLIQGTARDDSWAWTVGGHIYLSTTGTSGNTLTQTAPSGTDDCVVVVGVATHADRMLFNPSPVIVEIV